MNYLRPARPGQLFGRGRVVRQTTTVAFLAGELLDADDVVATATATARIIRRTGETS